MEISEITKNINEISLERFDPHKLLQFLLNITPDMKILVKDMNLLATLFAVRGTKINKILNTVGAEATNKIRELRDKYQIVESGKNTSSVTLARIGQIWAFNICRACFEGDILDPVDKSLPDGFPKAMRCSVYASLIYRSMIKTDLVCLKEAYAYHQYLLDCIINPNKRSNPSKIMSRIEEQIQFSIYTDEVRLEGNLKFGILKEGGAIANEIKPALEEAARRWREIIS
ncbi:unnamed protein product [Gordionus sp. m RMFG-2023]|uniref:uncharacterized protein LOC135928474 n=1 Tax=Gordionus sp. m RMFG-2023 TaxID=3053472 RepID=UPI0030DEE0AD